MFQIVNSISKYCELILIDIGSIGVFSVLFLSIPHVNFLSGNDPSLFAFVAICGLVSAMIGHMIAAFKIWVIQHNVEIRNNAEFVRINELLRSSLENAELLSKQIEESRDRIDRQNKVIDENRLRIDDQHYIILSLTKRIEECKVVREREGHSGESCG